MRSIRTERTEVLVIGAGAAGLRAAIELARAGVPHLVVGKRRHGDAHTRWAAGGINAVLGTRDPEDRWQVHAADTLKEGHFVCRPDGVEILAKDAPHRVEELAEWGCDFQRTDEGAIEQRYFGAQTYRRTCFVGDRTGEAILETLVEHAAEAGVPHREDLMVTELLVDGGRVRGACAVDLRSGELVHYAAGAVLLAAGGCTALYHRSSSRPDENTGDGPALAFLAGATLRDMEFVQFHPTGMVHPEEMAGTLVTEAVRGEGGRLFNREGERFMERYSPEHLELDARDVVARAIDREIREGRDTGRGGVLLDISHEDADMVRERLPAIVERFREMGIDVTRDPMEVAPTAHYAMGGVRVDFRTGETDLPGLYAAGEVTSGVHGANRLGGNSLAETVVFGRIAGLHLAETRAPAPPKGGAPESLARAERRIRRIEEGAGEEDPGEVADRLRTLLAEHAGIVRTGEGLRAGLRDLGALRERATRLRAIPDRTDPEFALAANLRHMLCAAEAILRSALAREESRGAHYREDRPDEAPEGRRNVLVGNMHGAMRIGQEPVPEPPPEVRAAIDEAEGVDYHHLE
jgi:succinate dehydrogenase / fumarate reductase, flavoprotein subunit